MNLISEPYDWKRQTLSRFLSEGNVPSEWRALFQSQKEELDCVSDCLGEYENILPPLNYVFRAFYMLSPKNIRVIILGQDPYHNGSAIGLCFSVRKGNKLNPSLKNIYQELKNEGFSPTENGELYSWAKQGCFLLNKALTVSKGKAGSHTSIWYDFTDRVVEYINENVDGVAWLLMGADAHGVERLIRNSSHKVFKTSHPSPYSAYKTSRGNPAFIGSGVFTLINEFLVEKGKESVQW